MADTFEYKDKDFSTTFYNVHISKYEQIVMMRVVDEIYKTTFHRVNSASEVKFLRNKCLPSDQYPSVSANAVHLTLMNSFFENIVDDKFVISTLTKNFKYEVVSKLWIFHLVSGDCIPQEALLCPHWIPMESKDEFSKFSSISGMFKETLEMIKTCKKLKLDETETRIICALIVLDSLRMFRKILKPKLDFQRVKKVLFNYQQELHPSECDSRIEECERIMQLVSRSVWKFSVHTHIFSFYDALIPDSRLDIYNAFLAPTPSYSVRQVLPVPKALRILDPKSFDQSQTHLRHASGHSLSQSSEHSSSGYSSAQSSSSEFPLSCLSSELSLSQPSSENSFS